MIELCLVVFSPNVWPAPFLAEGVSGLSLPSDNVAEVFLIIFIFLSYFHHPRTMLQKYFSTFLFDDCLLQKYFSHFLFVYSFCFISGKPNLLVFTTERISEFVFVCLLVCLFSTVESFWLTIN